MVSSQLSGSISAQKGKPLQTQLFLPVNQDVVVLDNIELDFSDVFGPAPVQPSIEVNYDDLGDPLSAAEVSEIVYNDPVVIYSRSHSLVGPSSCVSQSLKVSMLTLREGDESVDPVEHDVGKIMENFDGLSIEENEREHATNVESKSVGIEDFEVLKVVGQGAFGKVYQVRKKGTSDIYAMKVMRKDKIMEKNHAGYMKAERDILTKIEHPFIVQLKYSFQTKYRLYLVLDFINGGHLFFQLFHHGLFREDLARVYAAEIVSAVAHLHENGIMHRDLKPENILLDAEGHVVLTDFGLAKQFEENTRSNSMCGTVEYMAPEIVLGKGHDKAADWWSVGVLIFEMLTGKPPFVGNREKIQQKIMKEKVKLPGFLSSEAHSLLKGRYVVGLDLSRVGQLSTVALAIGCPSYVSLLLHKEAGKRLGSGAKGSDDIKRHKWFKVINWRKLEARAIKPSFCPEVAGKQCIANFEKRWTEMPIVDSPVASPTAGVNPFAGFSYVRPPASFLQCDATSENACQLAKVVEN